MNAAKIILLLLLPMNCLAQVWGFLPYSNDAVLSDNNGFPKDSFAYYFPVRSFTDSVHQLDYFNPESGLHMGLVVDGDCDTKDSAVKRLIKKYNVPVNSFSDYWETRTDSFLLSWFSFTLYKMNEPMLYNYYSGHEVYRFTWIRSFHQPVVIRIDKTDKGILITTKELHGQPAVPYGTIRWERAIPASDYQSRFVPIPFEVDTTRDLEQQDFTQLISLIDSLDLYASPSILHHNCHAGSDGAEWILEVQKTTGYYCAYRWSPRKHTPFNDIGRLMIKLSDLHKEEIY